MKKELTEKDRAVIDNFFLILNRFYIKVAALQSSYGMKDSIEKNLSNIYEKTMAFIKEKCEVIKKDKEGLELKIPVKHTKTWLQLKRDSQKAFNSKREYPRSLFIHLISVYDHFYSQLIKCYLSSASGNIMVCGADKQLTYQEIKDCTSIDDIKEKIFDKEVDILMRKSHSDQLDWLCTRLKGDNVLDKELISHFIEITERRNVFVHADGIVSKQYLNVCKQNQVKIDDKITLGSPLEITNSYFNASIDTLLELASNLTIYMTKTLYKDCDYVNEKAINNIFTYLQDQKYNVVQNQCQHIKKWPLNNEAQMITDINYILCFYLQNKEEEAKRLISEMDWSNCSIRFSLAKAILEKKWGMAAELMEKIGKNSEVRQDHYLTWPLFEKFRETKEFADSYKKLYGENFSSDSSFEVSETKKVKKKVTKKATKPVPTAKKVVTKAGKKISSPKKHIHIIPKVATTKK